MAVTNAKPREAMRPAAPNGGQRERVVRDIVQGLYEGRFVPGQRLTESQLTAEYAASRSTVREALNQLAASGIVVLTQQRGAQIRLMSIQEAIDSLVVTGHLYALAAQLAAKHVGRPGAKKSLQAALDRVTAFDPSSISPEHTLARDHFYFVLAGIAGNSELTRVLPGAGAHIFRVQFRTMLRAADRQRHADYSRIAEAVLHGRATAAAVAVRLHVKRAIDCLVAFRDGEKRGRDSGKVVEADLRRHDDAGPIRAGAKGGKF